MTGCDVIIVNYNAGEALIQCLQTLGDADGLQIHVVDNASTDDSLASAQQACQQPRIHWHQNTQNVGFAQAVNQAVAAGNSETILVLNPDCFIDPAQIAALQCVMQDHSVAMIGCRVLNADGSLQAASRRQLPTFWRVLVHQTGLSRWFSGINLPDAKAGEAVNAINGACVLINRDAFNAVGGFDPEYPLHFEDLDLFIRFQQAGHVIWYEPSVSVTHWQGHSAQDDAQVIAWKRQGLLRYFKKHRPGWETALLRGILKLL